MNDYSKFKNFLAWFVNQLNINNGITDGDKVTGLGYNENSSLRKHYADWRSYADFDLDCTINHQYGNYATTSNYINLANTGFNLIPEFDKVSKEVISLYIGNRPPKKSVERKSESISVANLGLSDVEPNQALQDFFDMYKSQIQEYIKSTPSDVNYSPENINAKDIKQSKASFLQWFAPLVDALKHLGGSATPKDARERIISNLNLSDDLVNETRGKTNHKKFDNEVAWARNYLAYEGYIDKKVRGIWVLTEKGKNVVMTRELASGIFLKWVEILKERRETALDGGTSAPEDTDEQILLENIENIEEYDRDTFLTEVFFDSDKYDDILTLLKRKKNIILQGAPGVGKSYMAKRLAYSIIEAKDESKIEMIQFHQSYTYEDFIEGFRPNIDKEGSFDLIDGVFKKFCKKASYDLDSDYFFIIDEINRGNLSKIMGELMLLLEHDKRGEAYAMKLTYSSEKFYVPDNVYVIGMMNTADRSLAMIDYALRRRFSFIPIEPAFYNDNFITDFRAKYSNADAVIGKMRKLNTMITEELDNGHQIGHSYFCSNEPLDDKDIEGIFKYEIEELLREYFFDNSSKLEEALRLL